MRRCSKCDLEKDDNQFYTYYHSTQGKNRTRKICNECISKQKAEYKNKKKMEKEPLPTPTPVEEIQPTTKQKRVAQKTDTKLYCYDCEEWLPKEDFYPRLKVRCKKCERSLDSRERAEKRAENGGSAKVPSKPNTYVDIYQKEQTFNFMKAMGYTFNEENGIWYKLPWKDKDGNFPLLDDYARSKPKPKTRGKHTKRKKSEISQEVRDQVIMLHKEGYSAVEVSKLTNQPHGTIWRWIENYKSKLGM